MASLIIQVVVLAIIYGLSARLGLAVGINASRTGQQDPRRTLRDLWQHDPAVVQKTLGLVLILTVLATLPRFQHPVATNEVNLVQASNAMAGGMMVFGSWVIVLLGIPGAFLASYAAGARAYGVEAFERVQRS